MQNYHNLVCNGNAHRTGIGYCDSHFGEFLQGSFPDVPEASDRAAISVPVLGFEKAKLVSESHVNACSMNYALEQFPLAQTGSKCTFYPSARQNTLISSDPRKTKSILAARLTLDYFGKIDFGGELLIQHSVPEGHGLGTSTSDVISTIRAVADSFYASISDAKIAQISLKAEAACDSLMYDRAGLFVTTKAIFLDDYQVSYPDYMILGLEFGEHIEPIDTLTLPQRHYTDLELKSYSLLRSAARYAFINKDIKLIGQIATQSAVLNQRHLVKSKLDEVIRISNLYHSNGIVCGHSGTVLGLLYSLDFQFEEIILQNLIQSLATIGVVAVKRYYGGGV